MTNVALRLARTTTTTTTTTTDQTTTFSYIYIYIYIILYICRVDCVYVFDLLLVQIHTHMNILLYVNTS